MSIFIKEMVKNKLKHLTRDELLHYSKQYGFQLTEAQAQQIALYLRKNTLDPFNPKTRQEMFQHLAAITDEQTASKAEQLLHTLIQSYGLEHLFQ
ncbi:DUF2624 domain-containing protein [Oceanobacillus polygoni]|uniref:Mn-dependent DtxR family transcriptional regulator n=1 Tax=Oceanobacillus polygoni TaxID=1235259 RepID=A0A9X1CI81_9BACI|nr:DUF2624 domain-containing protein [Oceanobacillus polygoni]MBP2078177.1 Mn-dependent DtxR family transcriptional regulator [Oceanobacillus polygoni]